VLLPCRVSDAPALGCAILAAVAAGLHPSIHAGVGAMVHTARVIQPDPQAHQEYQLFYRAYKALVRGGGEGGVRGGARGVGGEGDLVRVYERGWRCLTIAV
jgi:hypothetical protein